jgi:hypothetical protein
MSIALSFLKSGLQHFEAWGRNRRFLQAGELSGYEGHKFIETS